MDFANYANSVHHTIKFTLDYSTTHINFLDTMVYKNPSNVLCVRLYTKPTDTHAYLRFDSAHPPHCKVNGPYSQALRIKRNNTNISDQELDLSRLKGHYQNRGYPENIIGRNLDKATKKDRQDCLAPTLSDKSKGKNNIFLITTYNPCNPPIQNAVRHNWHVLESSVSAKAFKEAPILGHRKNKTLKDTLVTAKTCFPPTNPGIFYGRTMHVTVGECREVVNINIK